MTPSEKRAIAFAITLSIAISSLPFACGGHVGPAGPDADATISGDGPADNIDTGACTRWDAPTCLFCNEFSGCLDAAPDGVPANETKACEAGQQCLHARQPPFWRCCDFCVEYCP